LCNHVTDPQPKGSRPYLERSDPKFFKLPLIYVILPTADGRETQ